MSSGQAIEDIYPLSPMQQGMLFHILHTPDAGLNVLQMSCLLAGDLDVAAFRQALARVIERHAVLRTYFLWEDVEQPLQVVDREVPLPLEEQDWSGLSEEERRRCLDAYLEEDLARGFDLAQAPLMRVLLAREGEGRHRLVWSLQMILFDGWSMPAVIGEVLLHYEAFRAGEDPRLAVPRHYRDYIAWLLRKDGAAAERFWRGELAGFAVPTLLPGDRGPGRKPAMAQKRVFLPAEATAALQALARAERLTVSTLVQGAWALLLARSSGERDVVYGVTVSGRPPDLPGVESMIGLFINTLPARVRTRPGEPLVPWLRGLQERQAEARQYEQTPLVDIQGWSGVPRGLPLFDSLVVFENYPIAEVMRERSGSLAVDEIRQLDANSYPLTLEVVPGTRLSLRLTYDGARFTAAAIEMLLDPLSALLAEMPRRAGGRVGDLLGPTAEERRRLLAEWNRPALSMPPDPPLHRLFEAAADRAPGAPAVSCGGLETTYRELEQRANRLARHLRRLGVGPEERVGLCAERSPDLVAGILGILKAGGAYVPLDPELPAERLAYLLADSGVRALLTQERWLERLPEVSGLPVVRLDADRRAIEAESAERLADGVGGSGPENAAYVIYTSGSTGRPKGVVVTHANAARLLSATQPWFGFGPDDVWTLFHSYAFDFSVWEIWGALAFGGRLVIVPYLTSRDPSAFRALLAAERVTVLNQTPSAFRQLIATPASPLSLRYVIFGGEALEPRSLAPWFARYGDERPRLVNMYGITETTVHVTYRPVSAEDVDGPGLVGVPIPDLQVYLVDRDLELLPPWAPGEICVGGDGVARGYLGRPELTAERFVPDPWSPRPGARLYRSGDLARWLPLPEGGDLEYLGRIDQQVKIRGFRIEPGEIEAVLGTHPAVREAAVVARESAGGDRRLVAYVVPRTEAGISPPELRAFLGERLPQYMVPAVFVTLAALPLTANGKLDRRALSALDTAARRGGEPVPPETPAEEALARVWAEVLGLERVGVLDSFFALGGDSILSIRVLARAAELGYPLTLPQIFQHPTVRELARAVERGGEAMPGRVEPFSQLSPSDREGLPEGLEDAYPLALLQAGMLFHSEYSPETAAYHDIFSTHLEAPFDEALLRRAVERVVAAHALLRTAFDLTRFGEPLQLVYRNVEPDFTVEDLRALDPAAQEGWLAAWVEQEKAQPIDWTSAPMLRFRVHRRSETSFQITLSFHHAILDGWSVAVLLSELFEAYLSLCRGEEAQVPAEPPGAYARYVALERQASGSEASRRYWEERLAGAERTELPRWHAGGSGRRGARSREVMVPPDLSARLRSFSRAAGVPLKSLLLAVHCRVLSWLAGLPEVVTGLVVNGRPEEEGGERVLGLFLNTLPFRLDLRPAAGGGTWGDLVHRVFAAEAELLAHRRYPLAELQRRTGGAPLFEAVFNFVHFHVYQGLASFPEIRPLGGLYFEETQFDFLAGFQQDPFSGQIQLRLQYESSGFSDTQAEVAADLYGHTLAAVAEGPEGRCDTGPPLALSGRLQLLLAPGRSAPPPPEPGRPARGFVPPRGPIEEMLAGLWAELLDTDRVGAHDDFFDRGGHSLLATQMVSRVRVVFGVELPLRLLFDEPTVAGFAALVEAALRGGEAVAAPPLAARPRQGNPPLSFAQQRLWFIDQLVPGSTAYNMPVAVRFAGPLDLAALAGALAEVVRRHESLRTTFREEEGRPVQVIAAPGPFLLPLADLSGLPPEIREGEARRLAAENLLRPFDLARGPLFRPLAVRLAADDHLLPATLHHIVSDGWSMGVFVREVGALYSAAVDGRPSPLPELPVQYADYAEWQRGWLAGEVLAAEIAWWREELAGLPPHLKLATDRPRPPVQTFRGASRSLVLSDGGDGLPLAALARRERATPFMTWLAGFQALLGRHAGQDDLAVGTPVAGRTRVELEGLIGFFANTLVLRGDLAGDPGFRELLGRVRERVLGAQVHQHLPFEKLVEELETERDLSRTPIFQAMFVHRAGPDGDLEVSGLGVRSLPLETGTAQFDLLLAIEERGGRVVATLEHNRDLYDPTTADRLLERLRLLLAVAAADPDLPLSALPILSESERHQLLEWNDTDLAGPPPAPERVERPYAPPLGEVEEALAGFWMELLDVERVGRHDSFFELGGHSLLATQLRSRIHKTFDVDLPLAGLFARPTLAEIASALSAAVAARERDRTRVGTPGMKIAPHQRQRLRREDLE